MLGAARLAGGALLLASAATVRAQPAGVGLEVLTEPCVNASAPSFANQTFAMASCAGGACVIQSGGFPGLCVRGAPAEANHVLAKCDPTDSNQLFTYQAATGAIAQMPLSTGMFWNVYGGLLEPAGTNIQVFGDPSIPGNEQCVVATRTTRRGRPAHAQSARSRPRLTNPLCVPGSRSCRRARFSATARRCAST